MNLESFNGISKNPALNKKTIVQCRILYIYS